MSVPWRHWQRSARTCAGCTWPPAASTTCTTTTSARSGQLYRMMNLRCVPAPNTAGELAQLAAPGLTDGRFVRLVVRWRELVSLGLPLELPAFA